MSNHESVKNFNKKYQVKRIFIETKLQNALYFLWKVVNGGKENFDLGRKQICS